MLQQVENFETPENMPEIRTEFVHTHLCVTISRRYRSSSLW